MILNNFGRFLWNPLQTLNGNGTDRVCGSVERWKDSAGGILYRINAKSKFRI